MPIYAYKCRQCGEKFEQFRGIYDTDSEVECPKCGTKDPVRVLAPFFSRNSSGGGAIFPT
ncbi:MAG: zinc ribbon domain-containing protein [Chloroflexota bacterium]